VVGCLKLPYVVLSSSPVKLCGVGKDNSR